MNKEQRDFRNSITLLKSYLDVYQNGNVLMYLPMAVELRKLLCEKQPSPLVLRVVPGIKLYRLHTDNLFKSNPDLLAKLEHSMPGRIDLSKEPTTFNLSFAETQEKMNLDQWLDQMFFNEGITIRELIKSVADKEAAHADKNYNTTLLHCQNWTFNDISCHILGIYGISKFIYDLVTIEYSNYLS